MIIRNNQHQAKYLGHCIELSDIWPPKSVLGQMSFVDILFWSNVAYLFYNIVAQKSIFGQMSLVYGIFWPNVGLLFYTTVAQTVFVNIFGPNDSYQTSHHQRRLFVYFN